LVNLDELTTFIIDLLPTSGRRLVGVDFFEVTGSPSMPFVDVYQ
jgi:hypothetical protein